MKIEDAIELAAELTLEKRATGKEDPRLPALLERIAFEMGEAASQHLAEGNVAEYQRLIGKTKQAHSRW